MLTRALARYIGPSRYQFAQAVSRDVPEEFLSDLLYAVREIGDRAAADEAIRRLMGSLSPSYADSAFSTVFDCLDQVGKRDFLLQFGGDLRHEMLPDAYAEAERLPASGNPLLDVTKLILVVSMTPEQHVPISMNLSNTPGDVLPWFCTAISREASDAVAVAVAEATVNIADVWSRVNVRLRLASPKRPRTVGSLMSACLNSSADGNAQWLEFIGLLEVSDERFLQAFGSRASANAHESLKLVAIRSALNFFPGMDGGTLLELADLLVTPVFRCQFVILALAKLISTHAIGLLDYASGIREPHLQAYAFGAIYRLLLREEGIGNAHRVGTGTIGAVAGRGGGGAVVGGGAVLGGSYVESDAAVRCRSEYQNALARIDVKDGFALAVAYLNASDLVDKSQQKAIPTITSLRLHRLSDFELDLFAETAVALDRSNLEPDPRGRFNRALREAIRCIKELPTETALNVVISLAQKYPYEARALWRIARSRIEELDWRQGKVPRIYEFLDCVDHRHKPQFSENVTAVRSLSATLAIFCAHRETWSAAHAVSVSAELAQMQSAFLQYWKEMQVISHVELSNKARKTLKTLLLCKSPLERVASVRADEQMEARPVATQPAQAPARQVNVYDEWIKLLRNATSASRTEFLDGIDNILAGARILAGDSVVFDVTRAIRDAQKFWA